MLLKINFTCPATVHVEDGFVVHLGIFRKLDVLDDVVDIRTLQKDEELHVVWCSGVALHVDDLWQVCVVLLEHESFDRFEVEFTLVTHDDVKESFFFLKASLMSSLAGRSPTRTGPRGLLTTIGLSSCCSFIPCVCPTASSRVTAPSKLAGSIDWEREIALRGSTLAMRALMRRGYENISPDEA